MAKKASVVPAVTVVAGADSVITSGFQAGYRLGQMGDMQSNVGAYLVQHHPKALESAGAEEDMRKDLEPGIMARFYEVRKEKGDDADAFKAAIEMPKAEYIRLGREDKEARKPIETMREHGGEYLRQAMRRARIALADALKGGKKGTKASPLTPVEWLAKEVDQVLSPKLVLWSSKGKITPAQKKAIHEWIVAGKSLVGSIK